MFSNLHLCTLIGAGVVATILATVRIDHREFLPSPISRDTCIGFLLGFDLPKMCTAFLLASPMILSFVSVSYPMLVDIYDADVFSVGDGVGNNDNELSFGFDPEGFSAVGTFLPSFAILSGSETVGYVTVSPVTFSTFWIRA